MKKLIGISVIAALAVLPMVANAATNDPIGTGNTPATISPAPTGDAKTAVMAGGNPLYAMAVEDGTEANLATAGYVKGAYNAAIKAVNKVADMATGATGDIEARLETLTPETNGYDINAKTLDVYGNETVGGTLEVTGASTLTGNTTVGGTLGVTGATTLSSVSVTGNETVGGTLGVTGATTLSGGVTIADETTVTASGATITGTAQDNVAIQNATLTNVTIDASQNSISNIDVADMDAGAVVTSTEGIAAVATASDDKLVTEKAVRSAIDTINGNASDLDTRLTAAEGEIDNIQGTELPVMATWDSSTVTYKTIAQYTTATAARQ